MSVAPVNYTSIFSSLTADRLGRFRSYQTTVFSDHEVIQRYLYNIELSAEVNKAIHILEVVLRNQIAQEWNKSHCITDWPTNRKGLPTTSKFMRMHKKIDDAVARAGGAGSANGKVIAELSLGFWIHMFDPKFDVQNMKLVKQIFPLRSNWNKSLKIEIQTIRKDFETIGELRNRVAHHEPIFHLRDLNQKFDLIIRYINEINPSCVSLVKQQVFQTLRTGSWRSIVFP